MAEDTSQVRGTGERQTANPGGGTPNRWKCKDVFKISFNFVKDVCGGILRHKRKLAFVAVFFVVPGFLCVKGFASYSNPIPNNALKVQIQQMPDIVAQTQDLCQHLHILLDADTGQCRIQKKPILELCDTTHQLLWVECDKAIYEKLEDETLVTRNTTFLERSTSLLSVHERRSELFVQNCSIAQNQANDQKRKLMQWTVPGFCGLGIFFAVLPYIVNRRRGYAIFFWLYNAAAACGYLIAVGLCFSNPVEHLPESIAMYACGSIAKVFLVAGIVVFVGAYRPMLKLKCEAVKNLLAQTPPPSSNSTELEVWRRTRGSNVPNDEEATGGLNARHVPRDADPGSQQDTPNIAATRNLSEERDKDVIEAETPTAVYEDQSSRTSNFDPGAPNA